jgi:hypothetical protein
MQPESESLKSTGSSETIDPSKKCENFSQLVEYTEGDEDNQRFSLRKRRNINYNFKTKKFEYDGDDSDYEQTPKKKQKKK